MSPKTLTALQQSIAKWERNLDCAKSSKYNQITVLEKDCPLCGIYYDHGCLIDKDNLCPVFEKSGTRFCLSTPYKEVVEYLKLVKRGYNDYNNLLSAIDAEINFLKSLLLED